MITEKFKNIFNFASRPDYKAKDGVADGIFPFYTSSPILSKRIDKALYFDESIIIGTGGSANIHYSNEPFSTSADCIVAISKRDNVNTKYVYYYLLGNLYILEQGFEGAGLQHLSREYVESIEIPILSIDSQNRIVAILDIISSLITKREQTIQLLDELSKSYFLSMFGDPIRNDKKWGIELLKGISDLERGRFSVRPRNNPIYFGGKFPFIQTGDINNSYHRLKTYSQTLNEAGIKVSKKFKKGDIVIAIVGATIGATSILQLDAYATDSVIAVKPHKNTNNIFLEMLLRFYRTYLLEIAPQNARANINLEILGSLQIINPPLHLQKKYATFDQHCESNKEKLIISKNELYILFKSILQKSFSNELILDINFELDALINDIDLQAKENDLSRITYNSHYIQRLIEKLNNQEFVDKNLYDKAKHVAFQLLKEEKIVQKYDKSLKVIKLALK